MSIQELLGFLISLLAFIFLMYKRTRDENMKNKDPEAYKKKKQKEEDNLRLFLKSLDIEVPNEKIAPPPPPKPKLPKKTHLKAPKQEFPGEDFNAKLKKAGEKTTLEALEFNVALDERYADRLRVVSAPKYEVHKIKQPSKVEKIVYGLPSTKEMVILHAIMGPPKGMP